MGVVNLQEEADEELTKEQSEIEEITPQDTRAQAISQSPMLSAGQAIGLKFQQSEAKSE